MTDGERMRRLRALKEKHTTKGDVFDGRVNDFMIALNKILGR